MEQPSDAAVIVASLAEPVRFGAIFDRHAAVLRRYLIRRLGPDDAEGLLGEVFRIAFEKRATYDGGRPDARPWLYGIATRELARHRRSEARRLHAVARLAGTQETAAGDPAESVSTHVDASQRWARVAAAVTALPDPERDALVLFAWEDLGYDEIATALGIPVGTVRSRLNRARRRLREPAPPAGREPADHTVSGVAGGSHHAR